GILRSLGAGKKTVMALFTLQGAVLGTAGSLIGMFLGWVIAYLSVGAVGKTVSTIYNTVAQEGYAMSGGDALLSLLLGLCVSVTASALPSYEAARIRPNESSREGSFEGKYRGLIGALFLSGGLCTIAGALFSYLDYLYMPFGFPFLAYLGVLSIIIGFTLMSPFSLHLTLKVLRKPLGRIFRGTGKLTLGDMNGNVYRFSVALMSVAISGALIFTLVILITSFRRSLTDWIDTILTVDVHIKPSSCRSNFCFQPLSREVVDIVAGFEGVEDIHKFRALQVNLSGRRVVTGFVNRELTSNFQGTRSSQRSEEEAGERHIAVSEYVRRLHNLDIGDMLDIETPKGMRRFTVNETFVTYSSPSGLMILDRKWLNEYWGLDDVTMLSLNVREGVDVDHFISTLSRTLSGRYSLEIMNNSELREEVIATFNRSLAITYAIELVAIAVSLIGVINTLLTRVLERKREVSIIRYLGGSWRQLRNTFVLSSGIIGISGIMAGFFMGLLLSVIFTKVINTLSFGWAVRFTLPVFTLCVLSGIIVLAVVLAGFIPAHVARKIDPKRFISFE
ncbi:MAG: ABC transporter permease, partial [Planctomycetes bacterium]|nr:ABC transporter permease [Planctomycetota bacterium]